MSIRAGILIFMAGFAASVGQILVLRESLVIFYGNELSSGLVLGCWLLCTAAGSGITGRICRKRAPGFKELLLGFALLCAALPATIVWIRAARTIWSVPAGELISPWLMMAIAFCATGPICLLSGCLFALGWGLFRVYDPEGLRVAWIYLAEACGSGVGGLVFYFILLPRYPPFAGSLVLAILLLASAWLMAAGSGFSGKSLSIAIMAAVLALACVSLVYSGKIEVKSRSMQWGKSFLQSLDSAYHNIAVLSKSGQLSFFANGLWLFSSPDPQSAEPAAHLPLLQHLDPENVLVIGDYSPDLTVEILKHPGIVRVDCIQPDRELAALARKILMPGTAESGKDPRVRTFFMDPRQFMKSADIRYDVVILSAGEPVNAEMNRFYTVEFFAAIKGSLLNSGGVFSFRVACPPDIVGPREALLLRSLYITLASVFEGVLLVPGESACFLASRERDLLTRDPVVLIERMRARNLDLRYMLDYSLFDYLNPLRLSYFDSILGSDLPAKLNHDLEPVCYLYGLGLWSAQLHPGLDRFFKFISGELKTPFLFGLSAIFLGYVMLVRAKGSPGASVAFSTGICGAILIVVEIALILLYQIIDGSAYKQMALIIAFFMAGLAIGSAVWEKFPLAPFWKGRQGTEGAIKRLMVMQIGLAVYTGALFIMASPSMISLVQTSGRWVVVVCFTILALLAGMLGGGQFCAAVAAAGSKAGAGLYAADLTGAALGAVAGSLFFLPVLGIPNTFLVLSLSGMAASLSLLPRK